MEPRGGDSGIGASDPIPLEEGDFLERADSLDILGALGVDASTADVLRGVGSPDVRVAATLLGALLSQSNEGARMLEGGPELDEVVEERVTAVEEA